MVFHHNIDGDMKFRYCLIIIDHHIDEKTSKFDQNVVERDRDRDRDRGRDRDGE